MLPRERNVIQLLKRYPLQLLYIICSSRFPARYPSKESESEHVVALISVLMGDRVHEVGEGGIDLYAELLFDLSAESVEDLFTGA